MSKKLILIRHAKSYWGKKGRSFYTGDDHERPLNDRGYKNAKSMYNYFNENKINADFIFSSSARRALETMFYFKNKNITKSGYKICKDLYTFNYNELAEFIKNIDNKYKNVIIISHNPGIQDFCLKYTNNKVNDKNLIQLKSKFPTCAVAVLLSNETDWNSNPKTGFILKKFITPKSISD